MKTLTIEEKRNVLITARAEMKRGALAKIIDGGKAKGGNLSRVCNGKAKDKVVETLYQKYLNLVVSKKDENKTSVKASKSEKESKSSVKPPKSKNKQVTNTTPIQSEDFKNVVDKQNVVITELVNHVKVISKRMEELEKQVKTQEEVLGQYFKRYGKKYVLGFCIRSDRNRFVASKVVKIGSDYTKQFNITLGKELPEENLLKERIIDYLKSKNIKVVESKNGKCGVNFEHIGE